MKHAIQLSILLAIFGCHSVKQASSVDPQALREEPTEPTVSAHPLVGGYSTAAADDESIVAAAEFAVAARGKTEPNAHLKLEKIVDAEQQVVAGMNFRLTLGVSIDGKPREATAVVWWQAWRNPDPYVLTSWEWR